MYMYITNFYEASIKFTQPISRIRAGNINHYGEIDSKPFDAVLLHCVIVRSGVDDQLPISMKSGLICSSRSGAEGPINT